MKAKKLDFPFRPPCLFRSIISISQTKKYHTGLLDNNEHQIKTRMHSKNVINSNVHDSLHSDSCTKEGDTRAFPQLSLFVKLVCLRQSLQYEIYGLIARASEFEVTGPGLNTDQRFG